MRFERHHKNPLLKAFCPYIYSQFRSRDICLIPAGKHHTYHNTLSINSKFQYLLAVAYEIASEWTLGEEALANKLDDLWNEHKDLHISLGHPPEAPR